MAGCDIRRMDTATAETMMNPEILAVNQDPLGRQAVRVVQRGGLEVWRKPMSDGSIAAAFLNRTDGEAEIEVRWGELGLLDNVKLLVRDLWARQDVGEAREKLARTVPAHGTGMVRLSNG